ncbi:MAG TPA: PDZ domain-containing protein, partial [Candidatus Eisenbacteria bacterium]|nr:PDZ domain-containing protein [Candidatus Eisenbacteria bacterium]
WFGFSLKCDECSAKRGTADTPAVWRFGTLPQVYLVETDGPAAKAGIRRGDVLTHINGISLLTPEGGRKFGATRPGEQVRWTIRRDGTARTVVALAGIRPGTRPDRRIEAKDIREQINKLNDVTDLEQLRREIARINREIARRRAQTDLQERRAVTAIPAQRLRYAGVIGGTEVEVRGPGTVIVTETDDKDQLIINTGDAIVRIRVPEGLLRKKSGEDKPR